MFKNLLSGVKLISILSLFSSNEIHAQTNWSYLPNAPFAQSSIGRFEDVFFVNKDTGWVVSLDNPDYVFKTMDGGINWFSQALPTLPYAGCRSVEFINENIGFIASVNCFKKVVAD